MRKKDVKQENGIRDNEFSNTSTLLSDKKFGAHVPSSFSEMNECRFQGVQEPKRKSDMMQE